MKPMRIKNMIKIESTKINHTRKKAGCLIIRYTYDTGCKYKYISYSQKIPWYDSSKNKYFHTFTGK